MKVFGFDVGQAAMGAAGFIGTNLVSAQVSRFLPPEWQSGPTGPIVRVGVKAGVAVGGGMLLRQFGMRPLANAWMVGGGIAALVDLAGAYLLPALGLSDYEAGVLTDYEPGQLTDYDPALMSSAGAYGGDGAYGG